MNNDPELECLFTADQADRTLFRAGQLDWEAVEAGDRRREAAVKLALQDGRLHTAADYYHAAMILQHGLRPEDYLLAHELCIVAITGGEERARWLAAASEDRFLRSIGRPQRFGTQHVRDEATGQTRLYAVDPTGSDLVRAALNVPSPAEAERRVARE
ncbi:MAG TPA: hypothetical protein VNT01_05770 [Symbiobacteriaceae bacterium]|nr:hypothetical protein [Symbiobacteriaceae bacterium]